MFDVRDGTDEVQATDIADYFDGDWYHVCGVKDTDEIRLYVNGMEVANGDASAIDSVSNDEPLRMGWYLGIYPYYDGIIDEVVIHNRALEPYEFYGLQFLQSYELEWLPPLAKKDSFKAGRCIPIKFSITDEEQFVHDETVEVTMTHGEDTVFTATYGEGSDSVRINDEEEYYITNWKTDKKDSGEYTITVSLENGQSWEKTIELVGK